MNCNLCPRMCNAERTDFENKNGFCKMPLLPKVARAQLHFWEEPCISGEKGSGTVFFSGCSLKCVYCQNKKISADNFGKIITVQHLADIFRKLENSGANNINLVSPTHYIHSIIKALDIYKPKIPIVYNSSGYENVDALKLLKDYIDIYLMDFKYYDNLKAQRYSKALNYCEIVKKALLEAYSQQNKCVFDKNGILQRGLIVRHLLLPQGTNDAISIFNWVRENLSGAYFSIMSQYVPMGKAISMPPINRKVTKREYEKVLDYICNTDFKNCFYQYRSSAIKDYIPDFNLEGI